MSIESDVFEGGPIPKHTYETTDGSKPTTHGVHEPRTLAHTVTTGDEVDLHMMTEIGDGVFVQWSNCRACNKRVAKCKCPGGPVEPHYMAPWRNARFERSLDARPDPDYKLIPKLVGWLRERGYTVTRKSASKPAPEAGQDDLDFARDTLGPDATDDEVQNLADQRVERDAPERAEVTAGIDAAIAAVSTPTRNLENVDVDF